jgi:hypothetical protein
MKISYMSLRAIAKQSHRKKTDCHPANGGTDRGTTLAMTDGRRLPRSSANCGIARNDKKKWVFQLSPKMRNHNDKKGFFSAFYPAICRARFTANFIFFCNFPPDAAGRPTFLQYGSKFSAFSG